jgi:hypothetical protein
MNSFVDYIELTPDDLDGKIKRTGWYVYVDTGNGVESIDGTECARKGIFGYWYVGKRYLSEVSAKRAVKYYTKKFQSIYEY